ncbi:MAG: HlyD family efflux transporter periplasmic adaptor subunit [Planctomycetaceae bacterium]|nr:HlyD family efflux transporter periplasmic adaptor subunit [Planctomycetaceae bacterium]
MTTSQTQSSIGSAESAGTLDMVERLRHFDGPPEQFLLELLAAQCRVSGCSRGAILRRGAEGAVEIAAIYPPPASAKAAAPVWLATAAQVAPSVIEQGKTSIHALHQGSELYGEAAAQHLVLMPVSTGGPGQGVAAFLVESSDTRVLAAARQRLELSGSLLSLYEMRLTLQRREVDFARLRWAMEVLAAANAHDRFAATAMALCNELAARWQCHRVSLGFLKGRYVKLKATSHTEKFSRKMKLVQDIEAAAEECIDQDVEVQYPTPPEAGYVSRACGELARRQGPSAVLALPLRRAGHPQAVVVLERDFEKPFTLSEAEAIRLALDLCAARLIGLAETDRWAGARIASSVYRGMGKMLGPKHTWAKLAAAGVLAGVLCLIFVQGDYQAQASFVTEAAQRRVITAPFDGYLEKTFVEPDSRVEAGAVLAQLETRDLQAQLRKAVTDQAKYAKQADVAMAQGKTAEAQIAQENAKAAGVEAELLGDQIKRARIVSPVAGLVLVGDLKKRIGVPVSRRDVLFEVAPLDDLYADLSVSEDQITPVQIGQTGELATESYPQERIAFTVERITPLAEVAEQDNVFKVRVKLYSTPPWLRPGMTGVAKIDHGRKSLGWLWSRRLVNWVRMKLWL